MNEDNEMWRKYHESKRQKKLQNLAFSVQMLQDKGIKFTQFTEDHYRVGNYDFWPSTGKFYNQRTKDTGRGIFNLLRKIQNKYTVIDTEIQDMADDRAKSVDKAFFQANQ